MEFAESISVKILQIQNAQKYPAAALVLCVFVCVMAQRYGRRGYPDFSYRLQNRDLQREGHCGSPPWNQRDFRGEGTKLCGIPAGM